MQHLSCDTDDTVMLNCSNISQYYFFDNKH